MTDAARATVAERAANARIARNAMFLLLGQATTMALGVVYNGSLGRFLGADEFGVFFLISSFASVAYILVDWGQQRYVTRAVARSPRRTGELLGAGILLRTVATAVACVLTGITAKALGYGTRVEWLIVAFVGASLPSWLGEVYGLVFRGRERMGFAAVVVVIDKSLELVFAFTALYFGLGLPGIVVAQACAGGAAALVAARVYQRVVNIAVGFSRTSAREMFAGGRALAVLSLAVQAQSYIEVVLLSKLAPLETVGWFAAARTIMGAIFAVATILASAYFPVLSRTAENRIDFTRAAQKALRPMLWFGALLAIGTYLFAGSAIRLIYGTQHFSPAADILTVFGPAIFLFFTSVFFSHALTALGREHMLAMVKVCSVAISGLLAWLLIPYFQATSGNGAIGAVLAFILSEFVVLGSFIFLMPCGVLGSSLARDGARAIVAAALTGALVRLLAISAWLGIPICVLLFTAISFALGLVRREDVRLLTASVLDRPIGSP